MATKIVMLILVWLSWEWRSFWCKTGTEIKVEWCKWVSLTCQPAERTGELIKKAVYATINHQKHTLTANTIHFLPCINVVLPALTCRSLPATCVCIPRPLGVSRTLYGGITTSKSAARSRRERGEDGRGGERGGRAQCGTRMKRKFKVTRHKKGGKHQEREWGGERWKKFGRARGETVV